MSYLYCSLWMSVTVLALLVDMSLCEATDQLYMMDPTAEQSFPVEEDEVNLEQVDRVEEQILKLLGLPDSPAPHSTPAAHILQLKENGAAPQFMMHLYQEVQKQEGLDDVMPTPTPYRAQTMSEVRNTTSTSTLDITSEKQKIEPDVDIVISFLNHAPTTNLNIEHEVDKRYYFELDDVPEESELKEAELRLYKQPRSHHGETNFFITVFRIDNSHPGDDMPYSLTLLDSLAVNSSFDGWLVLNVTQAMSYWKESKSANKGLYLRAHTVSGEEVLPHRLGIVNKHGDTDKQGFMVAFFKSLEPLSKKIPEIRHRSSSDHTTGNIRKKRRARSAVHWDDPNSNRYTRKMCQRKHLYVKFKRLRFDSWIIAPDGYPAFYCEGECSFPLSSHMNATNHAIVQTLVSLIQPRKFPKACCAPKKLSAITVLYFDETQNVVMKRYRNMVVQSCGCH